MLYIIPAFDYPVANFLFSAIRSADTAFVTIEESFIGKVFRRLRMARISYFLPRLFARLVWSRKTVRKLKAIKKSDTLLFWEGIYNFSQTRQVAAIVKASRKYLWIWNTLPNDYPQRRINMLKKDYQLFTFDKNDAHIFGLNYKNQVYCLPQVTREETHAPLVHDFYFVGSNKNRAAQLNELKNALGKKYHCYFVIHQDSQGGVFDYHENLREIKLSRCLVDIAKAGQTGWTLRALEAAVYHKKLLTSNQDIAQSDLYHANNVFILGRDDLSRIDDFMQKPFVPILDETLRKYDINDWLREFR